MISKAFLPILIILFILRSNFSSIVPQIIHQTYDYQSPNFFLYLSIKCVQFYMKPQKHILWVNNEGRYRKQHWEHWTSTSQPGSWEADLVSYITDNKIEVQFLPFPLTPPGNESIYATNKAHISDFLRMSALLKHGGIYLDTDAFPISKFDSLLQNDFTISYDNIVDLSGQTPRRFNNGVMLSSPNSSFLQLWIKEYSSFDPSSWDRHSSIVPFELATRYPDLIHVEWHRLAPISYGFQTAKAAQSLTCGLFIPGNLNHNNNNHSTILLTTNCSKINQNMSMSWIWLPIWNPSLQRYEFESSPSEHTYQQGVYLYRSLSEKYVLHLTMSLVRGVCMMRKNLHSPEQLNKLPSYLGHIFRSALHPEGKDLYDYSLFLSSSHSAEDKLSLWTSCREEMGIHSIPELDESSPRQQYFPPSF